MSRPYVSSAGGIVFDTAGRVLLIKSRVPGFENYYNLAKGHVEDGESAERAAVREMFEETGYHCEIVRYLGEVRRKSAEETGEIVDKRISMFLVRIVGGQLGGTDEEAVWVEPARALAYMKHKEEAEFLRRVV